MQGYEYIAQTLKLHGVTHVFYMEAMLRIALREARKLGITGIMAHSENAAGYMADGYARASGRPGVCMAQSIGAANMAGGICDAWLATSPVIALTGKKRAPYQYKNAYQEADHRLLYEGITKFNAELTQTGQLPFLLRQAFRAGTTGKPRPIHLDLPNRMGRAAELGEIQEPLYADEAFTRYPAYRPAAPADMIAAAAAALSAAEKPVLVAGRGAAVSDAGDALLALCEKCAIPVVTTPDGKCIIDEDHPLWCGIVGGYGMDCANQTVRSADLVLFVGTQTADQTTCDWKIPAPATRVIHIDIDASEFGKNYPNTIGLLGDARTVLEQLVQAAEAAERAAWRAEAASYVSATLASYAEKLSSDQRPIRPERLCAEVSRVLPDDAVLVADTGFSAVWSATMLRMKHAQKYLRAAGSLGWSYPASLGVKCALPDRPVVCFTGDGAFYYHLSEMETAVRHGINTVTVINNNNILAQCSGDIKAVNAEYEDKGAPCFTFSAPRFSAVAKAFGCIGMTIEDPSEIGPAIQKGLQASKPVVIEVLTDGGCKVPPVMPV